MGRRNSVTSWTQLKRLMRPLYCGLSAWLSRAYQPQMMRTVEMPKVMRARRTQLGLSQVELAAAVGVDRRQIRRYESGEQQPTLAVAVAIARALEISVSELAGEPTHRLDLTGEWWAGWQTDREG